MNHLKITALVLLCVLILTNCKEKTEDPSKNEPSPVMGADHNHIHEVEVFNLKLKKEGDNVTYMDRDFVKYIDETNGSYLVLEDALLQNIFEESLANKDVSEFITTPDVVLSSMKIEGKSYKMLIPVDENKVKMKGGKRIFEKNKKGTKGCTFYFDCIKNRNTKKLEVLNYNKTIGSDSVMVRMLGFDHVDNNVDTFWYFSMNPLDIDTINKYLNVGAYGFLYSAIEDFENRSVTISSESKMRKINTDTMRLFTVDSSTAPYVAVLDPN